jgi:hypothetical protein
VKMESPAAAAAAAAAPRRSGRGQWDCSKPPKIHIISVPSGRNYTICSLVASDAVLDTFFQWSRGQRQHQPLPPASPIEEVVGVSGLQIARLVKAAVDRFGSAVASSRSPLVAELPEVLAAAAAAEASTLPSAYPGGTSSVTPVTAAPAATLIVDAGYVREKVKRIIELENIDSNTSGEGSSSSTATTSLVVANKQAQLTLDVRQQLFSRVQQQQQQQSAKSSPFTPHTFPAVWVDGMEEMKPEVVTALKSVNATPANAKLLKNVRDGSVKQCGVDVLVALELIACAAREAFRRMLQSVSGTTNAGVASSSSATSDQQRLKARLFLLAGDGDLSPAVMVCRALGCDVGLVGSAGSVSDDLKSAASFLHAL